MAVAAEQVYRYAAGSSVATDRSTPDVVLATSGGTVTGSRVLHPRFFDGFLDGAEQMAQGLLSVARVARTRYYSPPSIVAAALRAADPVVTSNGDRLRFESFSACCGVYSRLDILPEALDRAPLATGTTNVDFNPSMREALARVGGSDPLHLKVGEDVEVTTLDARVIERKVPLSMRWLKGFAEVQIAATAMEPVNTISASEARRFIRSLPRVPTPRVEMFAVPAGHGLRLASRGFPGAVSVGGPDRLRALESMLRFATSLTVYAPAEDPEITGSVWELQLCGARFQVALSPDSARGFSGEGAVLSSLADDRATEDAESLFAVLAHRPMMEVDQLAAETGLGGGRAVRAMAYLSAAGRVGFDVAARCYFQRELPFDPRVLAAMHPRLADARSLVESGGVRLDGDAVLVRSGDADHVVTFGPEPRCTCPWYSRYGGSRGPCKHVLAAFIATGGRS